MKVLRIEPCESIYRKGTIVGLIKLARDSAVHSSRA